MNTSTTASAQAAYDRDACSYDGRTASYQKYRRETVGRLPVQRGDVVLDVGCGTGLCLGMLRDKIGSSGRVVGIDESPHMIELAAERAADHDWDNVTLVESAVQDAEIPVTADAAVFCATHDILQSRPALENVFGHLQPGAWIVASGGKWAPAWKVALNFYLLSVHQPFVRSFEGFDRPWRLLDEFVEDLTVDDVAFGGGYLALGHVPTDAADA